MASTFFRAEWHHDPPHRWGNEDPVFIYTEMDEDRWEQRKVEVFPDGSLGWADADHPRGRTGLAKVQIPPLDEIRTLEPFTVEVIEQAEFEAIWRQARSQDEPADRDAGDGLPRETPDLFYPSEPARFVLGDVAGTSIGKDLEAAVVVTDGDIVVAALDTTVWFINSSLPQYRASLAFVGGHRHVFSQHPADESAEQRRIDALEGRLRVIDEVALVKPRSYWASILEQMRHEQF